MEGDLFRNHELFEPKGKGKKLWLIITRTEEVRWKRGCLKIRLCQDRLTVIQDQVLNIAHDLRIALVRICGDRIEPLAGFLRESDGMRMQHKRYGQESLSPEMRRPHYPQ